MTDHHEPDPLPPPPPAQSSEAIDERIRAVNRRHAIITGLIAAPLVILAIVATLSAVDSKEASEEGSGAIVAVLADNGRSACITERRNREIDAIGDMVKHSMDALGFYLIDGDGDAALEAQGLYEDASQRRDDASASLESGTIDQAPPIGCGPPVLSPADLDR